MSTCIQYRTIYYNDNNNTFEDEYGADYDYDISEIMENEQVLYYKKVGGTVYSHIKGDGEDGEDFEVIFPIRDINRTLYYDVQENLMYDEYGATAFNIFSIVLPSYLYLFKQNKNTIEVPGVNGGFVELIWPDCLP